MSEEKDFIVLRTYNAVWKIDRKIYSIEGLKLLFPVSINEAIYFMASLGISILLGKLLPIYKQIHFIIKYIAVPYALMQFLTKQKLDGKLPHKFFFDFIVYKFSPQKYARFKFLRQKDKYKFVTPLVYRDLKIVNKTDLVIKRKE